MMAVKMADYCLADKMDSYSVAGKACSLVASMEVSTVDYLADALVDKRVGC